VRMIQKFCWRLHGELNLFVIMLTSIWGNDFFVLH
jgi:hypothetical protein